jgi:hypothetical protein
MRSLKCLFGHRWNSYLLGALAPDVEGSYHEAELPIQACDRCGKVK